MQTPAYKRSFRARSVVRKKQGRWSEQRGLDVKRVEHAVAVVTTTHPVAVRHVNNNMAPALFLRIAVPRCMSRAAGSQNTTSRTNSSLHRTQGFGTTRALARAVPVVVAKQNLRITGPHPPA
jgi:hypothetical protein